MTNNIGDAMFALYGALRTFIIEKIDPELAGVIGQRVYFERPPNLDKEDPDRSQAIIVIHELGGKPDFEFGIEASEKVRVQISLWTRSSAGLAKALRWRGMIWAVLDEPNIAVNLPGYGNAVLLRQEYGNIIDDDWQNMTTDYDVVLSSS